MIQELWKQQQRRRVFSSTMAQPTHTSTKARPRSFGRSFCVVTAEARARRSLFASANDF